MNMSTTTDLAQRLYERWRQQQDFYQPAEKSVGWDMERSGFKQTGTYVMPRPKWDRLDTVQQNIWRAVAGEAAGR